MVHISVQNPIKCTIYALYTKSNPYVYVGQTIKTLEERLAGHKGCNMVHKKSWDVQRHNRRHTDRIWTFKLVLGVLGFLAYVLLMGAVSIWRH